MEADGTDMRLLRVYEVALSKGQEPLTDIFPPQWSPDGEKILVAYREGLRVTSVDGNDRLLVEKRHLREAIWSPDGSQIAFTNGKNLFLVDSAGSDERNVTGNEGIWLFHDKDVRTLAWSHDGSRIAFSYQGKLMIVDSESLQREAIHTPSYGIWFLEWSGNDEQLLFVSGAPNVVRGSSSVDRGYLELFTIRPDGSGLARLHKEYPYDVRVVRTSLSADGSMFVTPSPLGSGRLWVLSSDGKRGNELGPRRWCYHPQWSPHD
jgi:Tol biopolymer transport system component